MMKKKKEDDDETIARTWAMINSSPRIRRLRKQVRDVSLADPITDPENSLLFSGPIFDY
jgi:hypothetical protein